MVRAIGLFVALVGLAFSPARADDLWDNGPTWTPLAFYILKPEGAEGPREVDRGTRVVVRLELPGQHYIIFEPAHCKVDSFTDDKNTDLLAAPPPRGAPRWPRVSAGGWTAGNGRNNDFTFYAPGCPSKGATKIRIKGTVSVLVGKDEKQTEVKDVELKTGAKLEFGKLELQRPIGGVVAGGLGKRDRDTILRFQGSRPLSGATLLDGDGKEIPCHFGRSNQTPTNGTYIAVITIKEKQVDRCTVRVKYFDTVEEVKVPVDLEVGPGL